MHLGDICLSDHLYYKDGVDVPVPEARLTS